ncbi:MAG: hypothetical protein H6Q89_4825, partial [Myxococcaceae bacterium]|nr:hypothetical protein [Myxococcaceae bacterium]
MKAFACAVCALALTACELEPEPVRDAGTKSPTPTTLVAGGSCPKS